VLGCKLFALPLFVLSAETVAVSACLCPAVRFWALWCRRCRAVGSVGPCFDPIAVHDRPVH
jgi:hypothetical protein